ncbi:hypothetical protein L1987_18064 [Smallanthus sonchifolius]|uniref:Uncharacterized protein n=1 Tax=Smallanthus sonchifolius TaxID=185202 RepID=A0ACB9J076_9ASTR|nr:hypothetical protein L1987_18064 [Smallanthus sonchifolius]
MACCVGVNQTPHSYGGDRVVDSSCRAFGGLYAKVDKFNMILKEIRDVIVGGRDVHKNHKRGYFDAIQHPHREDIGSTSRNYRHLVNMKMLMLILYNDFSYDEEYIYFDANTKAETDEFYNYYDVSDHHIEVKAIILEVMEDVSKVEVQGNKRWREK